MSKHLFVNLTAGNIAVSNPEGTPIPVRPWLQRPRSALENIETLKSSSYIMEGEHYATMVSKNGPLYPLPEDFIPQPQAAEAIDTPDADEETVEVEPPVTTEDAEDESSDDDDAVDDRNNLIHNLDSDKGGKD